MMLSKLINSEESLTLSYKCDMMDKEFVFSRQGQTFVLVSGDAQVPVVSGLGWINTVISPSYPNICAS